MALIMDYESNSNLLPEGEYEMVVKSAHEDATKGGTQHISIPLVVRNDVEQKFQNAYLWHVIWRAKNPTTQDKMFGGYLSSQLMRFCEAVGIPKAAQFSSLEELFDTLKGKPVRATVYHEEYKNQTNAKLKYANPTKYPDCKHAFKSKPSEYTELTEEEEGDLPF